MEMAKRQNFCRTGFEKCPIPWKELMLYLVIVIEYMLFAYINELMLCDVKIHCKDKSYITYINLIDQLGTIQLEALIMIREIW